MQSRAVAALALSSTALMMSACDSSPETEQIQTSGTSSVASDPPAVSTSVALPPTDPVTTPEERQTSSVTDESVPPNNEVLSVRVRSDPIEIESIAEVTVECARQPTSIVLYLRASGFDLTQQLALEAVDLPEADDGVYSVQLEIPFWMSPGEKVVDAHCEISLPRSSEAFTVSTPYVSERPWPHWLATEINAGVDEDDYLNGAASCPPGTEQANVRVVMQQWSDEFPAVDDVLPLALFNLPDMEGWNPDWFEFEFKLDSATAAEARQLLPSFTYAVFCELVPDYRITGVVGYEDLILGS